MQNSCEHHCGEHRCLLAGTLLIYWLTVTRDLSDVIREMCLQLRRSA